MDFLKDLIHSFIPIPENDYKPHFFRVRAVLTTAAVIVALAAGSFAVRTIISSNYEYLAAVVASALVDLTNGDRSSNGLEHLAVSPVLQRAAELKAADMSGKSYFAHNSPDGLTPWHWFREAGYDFAYAGENLATYFSDSVDVERAWMNSPGHRANILNEHFTEVGIATAQGSYNGVPTVFVVQMFGTPAAPQPASTAAAQAAPAVETPSTNAPSQVAGTSTPSTTAPATTTVPKPAEPATPPTPQQAGTSTPKVTITSVSQPVATTSTTTVLSFTATTITLPDIDPLTKVLVEDDTFIAVKKTTATDSPLASVASAGISTSLVQRIATSPRSTVNMILFAIAGLIAVALALMIGIELKRQHPLNILYGIALLALIAGIIWFWHAAFPGTTVI